MASVVRGTEAKNPLLAPGFLGPRPNNKRPATFWLRVLLNRGLYHYLAPVLGEPGPIPLFGFGYLENRGLKLGSNCKNATAPLYASVLGQPRHIRRVMVDGDAMLSKPFQSSLGCFHPGKGGSSQLSESDDEEAHDEDDYYFSMVKTLTENDISSSKLYKIDISGKPLWNLFIM
ncbi:hypothetical protein DEO72_LG7g1354 [Vigna unguiculata]|uniref:Uncharacterized protein n=1 Tax=Vigna unguiculata TaxID=3917 RepID=A0A4D6MGC7_VIGUN|nr:hypothetical protein DEO72_LG7g1354 [Vigna unguiculata]